MIIDKNKIKKRIEQERININSVFTSVEYTARGKISILRGILEGEYNVEGESSGTFKDKLSNIAMLIRNIGEIALSLNEEEKKEVDKYLKDIEKI